MTLKESIRKVLREETNSKRDNLLKVIEENGLYDFTQATGLNYWDIAHELEVVPRDLKIQYLKDVISDLQQTPHELDLTFITGAIPMFEDDNREMVYVEYLSNEDNVLRVHFTTFGEDGRFERIGKFYKVKSHNIKNDYYNTLREEDIDSETLETLVSEISEKLQHKRDTRI
jgi:DNA polymerase III delta prime subunit